MQVFNVTNILRLIVFNVQTCQRHNNGLLSLKLELSQRVKGKWINKFFGFIWDPTVLLNLWSKKASLLLFLLRWIELSKNWNCISNRSHPAQTSNYLHWLGSRVHVPVIQNPPGTTGQPALLGEEDIEKGGAGNCIGFKMEIFEIGKEGKLLSPYHWEFFTWRDKHQK